MPPELLQRRCPGACFFRTFRPEVCYASDFSQVPFRAAVRFTSAPWESFQTASMFHSERSKPKSVKCIGLVHLCTLASCVSPLRRASPRNEANSCSSPGEIHLSAKSLRKDSSSKAAQETHHTPPCAASTIRQDARHVEHV